MKPEQASILFADFAGFSRLLPAELSIFVTKVMPLVGRAFDYRRALVTNTWGDGIFLVFKMADVAADCALRLRDEVAGRDWTLEGIQNDLGLRVALHNANVLINKDPLRLC